jgi:hypothetical protein
LLPATWAINGVQFDANGTGKIDVPRITVIAPDALTLNINLNSGEINGLLDGNQLLALRDETLQGGERMTVSELVTQVPSLAVTLDHMLASVVHTIPTPTPTATPTSTSTPSAPPPVTATP